MNPDDILLQTMSKNFEYDKVRREIDAIDDVVILRDLAKSFIKLYMKQQETLTQTIKMTPDSIKPPQP